MPPETIRNLRNVITAGLMNGAINPSRPAIGMPLKTASRSFTM